jgi:CBS domain-containing protein
MRIGDVMDRDLTSVTPERSIGEVIEILARHRLTGIPVVDDDLRVVGFISEKDIVRAALPGYFDYLQDASFIPDFGQFQKRLLQISRHKVSQYMTNDVDLFEEDDSDFAVAMTLAQHGYIRGPVVKDGILVGMANRSALLGRILTETEGS